MLGDSLKSAVMGMRGWRVKFLSDLANYAKKVPWHDFIFLL